MGEASCKAKFPASQKGKAENSAEKHAVAQFSAIYPQLRILHNTQCYPSVGKNSKMQC